MVWAVCCRCIADLRTLRGKVFYEIFSIIHMVVVVIICVCYTTITGYMHHSAKRLGAHAPAGRYHR